MKQYFVVLAVVALLVVGCEKKEEQAPIPQPVEQVKPTLVDQAKDTVEQVAEQASEMVESASELVKETGAATEQAVKEVVTVAVEDVSVAAEVAEEKVEEIVVAAEQQIAAAEVQLKQEGAALVNGLLAAPAEGESQGGDLLSSVVAVATESATTVEPPMTVVVENAKGDVTIPHAMHGKRYGCPTCHGDTTPGPFELGKDRAHKLCKDCHKLEKVSVSCSKCHKK